LSPRRRCRSTTPARSSKALQARFPLIAPHKEDICYATTNRQEAVKRVAPLVDALIVVGSPNSSNSQRLREVAERAGCPVSRLVQRTDEIDWSGLRQHPQPRHHGRRERAGGAGRGDHRRLRAALRRHVETVSTADENVFFPLPRELRGPSGRVSAQVERATWRSIPKLPTDETGAFVARYGIGDLLSYKGIAEGVENSNFLLHTSKGFYILTLYEKRVERRSALLPRPDGASRQARRELPAAGQESLTGSLSARSPAGPAAIITFLEGISVRRPNAMHCAEVGAALALLHQAGADFGMERVNSLSVPAGGRSAAGGHRADTVSARAARRGHGRDRGA
jgi:hypothetical protein